jgi:hypothetical protein
MAPPLVSILVVSKRPAFVPVILGLIAGQTYRRYEVILTLHGFVPDRLDPAGRAALAIAAELIEAPDTWTLGRCLNEAVGRARGDLLAKMDDDDLYGRDYLAEAAAAYERGCGDLIGKYEAYVYLASARQLRLRFPGAGMAASPDLHGPTPVFSRDLGRRIGFRDMGGGVMRQFMADCRDAGMRCYATSRRNFILRRFAVAHGHIWSVVDGEIVATSMPMRNEITDDSATGLLDLIGG